MKSVEVNVGLDYRVFPVQVCVMESATGRMLFNEPCENDWRTIRDRAERFGRVRSCAIEACCGAADLADELIQHAGWTVRLAHPGYVARMRGNPDKHDMGDAQLVCDLDRVGYLPCVWLAPEEVRELRRLMRYRVELADERRNTKLRLLAVLRDLRIRSPHRRWTRPWFEWLAKTDALSGESRWVMDQHLRRLRQREEEIATVEQRLQQATHDDPLVRRLCARAGIGLITACTLRAEIGNFSRFPSGKSLSRFCGLTPRSASSGQRQADAGLIHACNRWLRTVLIELGHRLMRSDPAGIEMKRRMRAAGKPGSVIAAAVANRYVRRLHHEMRRPEPAPATVTKIEPRSRE